MRKKISGPMAALAAIIALVGLPDRATAENLPVISGFQELGSNNAEVWNTIGNGYDDLFVAQNGTFLNAPNGSVNITLALGTNTFDLYGDYDSVLPSYGLVVYLAGQPGYNNVGQTFYTNASPGSPSDPTPPFTFVNGYSYQGSYTEGKYLITLTQYYWQAPDVQNMRVVGPSSPTPDGSASWTGEVSFTVADTSVPEPSSIVLMGLAVAIGSAYAIRRKRAVVA